MSDTLPEEFKDLERYAAWALPTEKKRNLKRCASDIVEIRQFYEAVLPRAQAALDYLNGFPLDSLNEPNLRLLNLCLMLAESAVAIEMYGHPAYEYSMPIERFTPLHDAW